MIFNSLKKRTGLLIVILIAVIIIIAIVYFLSRYTSNDEVVDKSIPVMEYDIPIDSFYVEEHTVQENEVLSNILHSLGATNNDIANISTLSSNVFDVRTIRSGNKYKAFFSSEDSSRYLCYFVYEKSPIEYAVICFKDTFNVYHGEKEIEKRLTRSSAEIKSSLWNATVENGITPTLAMNLSDIYAWTIDFFGLQKGDRFTVMYDKLYIDTTFIGIGRIHAAEFFHADKNYYAFYFEQDSLGGYWDETGNSLRRAFLKAPLKFSRISSHFSYSRKHPVLRIFRAHTGVDYAAPSGTPVMTIGNGTVIEKGYKGGGGNTVKIRHNSMYTTAYLHLSKFASDIKVGGQVAQGQVIGYVGSTGLSTGPHLDFRVWKNGQAVNPLTIESPPVEPINQANKPTFDSIQNLLQKGLRWK